MNRYMESSPLLLLLVPVLVAAVPMLLWEAGDWRQAVSRLGILGLGVTAWVDLLDNCASCAEDDPALLSGAWILSLGLVAAGGAALLARRRQRG
jgi:hypothetical protein